LLFFKVFDPEKEELRYLSHLQLTSFCMLLCLSLIFTLLPNASDMLVGSL
jgi:hypothetical protein